MSEVITLKQFDGSTVTPKDDAIMYDSFSGETGLLEGCDLTHTGAGQIRIGAGRGIIKGRQFVVQEHTINVTLSSDSDIPGRVYIRMDLSDTSEPVKILHVTAAVLPELEQDENCNNDNGVYEIELGTYIASKLTISNLEKTINRISPKLAKSMVVDNPDDVGAVTEEGFPVGCVALNGLLSGIRFGVDDEGNYGYIKAGADTVTPFNRGVLVKNVPIVNYRYTMYTQDTVYIDISTKIRNYKDLTIDNIYIKSVNAARAWSSAGSNGNVYFNITVSSYAPSSGTIGVETYFSVTMGNTATITINLAIVGGEEV